MDPTDEFAYTCINMGVPIRTAIALSEAVYDVLQQAKVPEQDLNAMRLRQQGRQHARQMHADTHTDMPLRDAVMCGNAYERITLDDDVQHAAPAIESMVRHMQVDTGCDKTMGDVTHSPYLQAAKDASEWRIMVADSDTEMTADSIGKLHSYVANTSDHPDIPPVVDWDQTMMTIPNIRRNLMSVEDKYRYEGYELHLPQPENGPCELTNVPSGGNTTIPIRKDNKVGGFWVDYIPYNPANPRTRDKAYRAALDYVHEQRRERYSEANMTQLGYNMYTPEVAESIDHRCRCSNAISEIITCQELEEPAVVHTLSEKPPEKTPQRVKKTRTRPDILARHPDDVEIRGVKRGLKRGKDKLTLREFHHDYGHLGECPGGCHICDMVKGVMRRIPHSYDPYIPRTPGRNWTMDMVTVSDRSDDGYKYMLVLRSRDQARLFKLLFLKTKDEAWSAVAEWIRTVRRDPVYNCYDYEVVSHIKTDRDGAWDHDTAIWQKEVCQKLNVEMEYISPDRHDQNGQAERNCGIIEATMKSLLMTGNLSPQWWVKAAQDAEWLLNRLPPISSAHNIPLDGDRARPLEIATNYQYSRRQIDRELSYYIPVGTPCLVHDTLAKGSSLTPKVRWGIACGMYRETVKFRCPFVHSTFHSKSYTAYKLRHGLSYTTFLGLKPVDSTRRGLVLPGDELIPEHMILQLPKPTVAAPETRETHPDKRKIVNLYSPEIDTREIPTSETLPQTETNTLPQTETNTQIPTKEQTLPQTETDTDTNAQQTAKKSVPPDHSQGGATDVTRLVNGRCEPPPTTVSGARFNTSPHPTKPTQTGTEVVRERETYGDPQGAVHMQKGAAPGHDICSPSPIQGPGGRQRLGSQECLGGTRVTKHSVVEPETPVIDTINIHKRTDHPEVSQQDPQCTQSTAVADTDTGRIVPAPGVDTQPRHLPGGGSLTVLDRNEYLRTDKYGNITRFDHTTNSSANNNSQDPNSVDNKTMEQHNEQTLRWGHTATGDMWDITLDDDIDWDAAERRTEASRTVTSRPNESFRSMMRRMKQAPHPDLLPLYRIWLIEHSPESNSLSYEMIPDVDSRKGMKSGIRFPPPTGRSWRVLVQQHADHSADKYDTPTRQDEYEMFNALAVAYSEFKMCKTMHKHKPTAMAATSSTVKPKRSGAQQRKRTVMNAIVDALRTLPKTLKEAFTGPDATGWHEAADSEMATLTEMGTVDHGYTASELKDAGIQRDPITMSIVLTNKYVDGVFERHKVRMAIAGHKWNMTKGIDYTDVYAPAPNVNTARLMAAMTAQLRLHRKAWDIKLAYCWADLPEGQPLLAVKYPKGYEKWRTYPDGTREPEYMILRRNCYGLPAAGKAWADHRDAYMMDHFNNNGYTCKQCTYDPCLFYITRGERIRPDDETTRTLRPYPEEAWVSIHTDDCDAIGTTEAILTDIYTAHDTRWQAKIVDANFLLGIHRKVQTENGERSVVLTQTAYVDGMMHAFQEEVIEAGMEHKTMTTPFPQGVFLRKSDASDEEARIVQARGYRRLVGMLLWATRGVFPECQQGCSQLGHVLSNPSEQAWKCGIHMLKWMHDHRTHGLRFTSTGNMMPIIFSDASNKPDPDDGFSRYGFAAMLAGGPIATTSKKLAHVGLSAFHNEYMALRHAAGQAMWIRNLARESGLSYMTREPTIIYGDNQAANKLTKEDFISSGNQYIYLPYHWVKELTRAREIAVRYVPTKANISDVFTKSVGPDVIRNLYRKLTGHDLTWVTDAEQAYAKHQTQVHCAIPYRSHNDDTERAPQHEHMTNIHVNMTYTKA